MVDRIIMGNINGVEGLKISKPGIDVSSTNVNDFLVHPDAYMGRVYATTYCTQAYAWGPVTRQISAPGNDIPAGQYRELQDYVVRIDHGFGYIPVFCMLGAVQNGDVKQCYADLNSIYATVGYYGPYLNTFGGYYYQNTGQLVGPNGFDSTWWYWDMATNSLKSRYATPSRILVFREQLY